MPPVAGASRLTAGAKNALVETIEEFTVLHRLQILLIGVILRRLALKEWLNLFVLGVEVGHVDDQVFQDEHEHERRDHTFLVVVFGNTTKAGKVMASIDVHGAGAADTFSARATEAESWVDLILDLDKGIKEHRSTLFRVDVVSDISWAIIGVVRVAAIDVDALHVLFLFVS